MNIYNMYLPCGVVEIVVDNDALYAGMDRFERSNGDRLWMMLNTARDIISTLMSSTIPTSASLLFLMTSLSI